MYRRCEKNCAHKKCYNYQYTKGKKKNLGEIRTRACKTLHFIAHLIPRLNNEDSSRQCVLVRKEIEPYQHEQSRVFVSSLHFGNIILRSLHHQYCP